MLSVRPDDPTAAVEHRVGMLATRVDELCVQVQRLVASLETGGARRGANGRARGDAELRRVYVGRRDGGRSGML